MIERSNAGVLEEGVAQGETKDCDGMPANRTTVAAAATKVDYFPAATS